MTIPFLSLDQMAEVNKTEQDWLFDKLLRKLTTNNHLILTADPAFCVKEYVHELGFQLEEKYPDIDVCYMDVRKTHSSTTFLEHYVAVLTQRFPEVASRKEIDNSSSDALIFPALIARRKANRVAVFLANSHLFHRYSDPVPFLRIFKSKIRYQKNCVFCLTGNNNAYFRDLVDYPGPLHGLGKLYNLRHNPLKNRSASIRKLFHDHNKSIGYNTSVHMASVVDNHPFYLKLLVWHCLIRGEWLRRSYFNVQAGSQS